MNDDEATHTPGSRRNTPLTKAEKAMCQTIEEDGTNGSVNLVRLITEDLHFSIVICDGAHCLKNETTRLHQLVADLKKDCMLLSSVTPMLNHPKDNLSYLRLAFWSLPPVPALPPKMQVKGLYTNDFQGDMPYLPLGSNGYKSDSGDFMPPVAGFQSLLARDPSTDQERRLVQAFEDDGYRWWTLSPRLFRLAARQH